MQRSHRLAAPECLRALAMASWAIRSSSYSTSAGSRGPCSSRVTWTAIGEVVLTWLAYAERLSPRPGAGGELVPQVEDRVPQLGDHAGHLAAQLADLLLLEPGRRCRRRGCRRGSRATRRPGRHRRAPRGRSAGAPRWSRCRARARRAGRPAAARRDGRAGCGAARAAEDSIGAAASRAPGPRSSRRWRPGGSRRAARAASSLRTPSTCRRASSAQDIAPGQRAGGVAQRRHRAVG